MTLLFVSAEVDHGHCFSLHQAREYEANGVLNLPTAAASPQLLQPVMLRPINGHNACMTLSSHLLEYPSACLVSCDAFCI
jgi:hypothetical protein